MTTFLYARVSPAEQAIEVQWAQARQAGLAIDETVVEQGKTETTRGLAECDEGKRLFERLRCGDTLVVRWVDRLGGNYHDIGATIGELMRRGVTIKTILNGLTFDGTTEDPIEKAARDAVIGFMSAAAQAQSEATKAARRAGIARAKENNERAYLGRKPSFSRSTFNTVRDMLGQSIAVAQIAKDTGLSRQAVYRIKEDPAGCEAALTRWANRQQADLQPIAARLAELFGGEP